jgi:ABC-2 type transport system permease protein
LKSTIDNQNALLVLYIPVDFSRDVASGRATNIQAIVDGRRSNSGQIALGYVESIIQSYNNERLVEAGQIAPSEIILRHWFNPNLNYKFFVLPSLVAMITTISVLIVTSLSIAREREQGTFDQLLVSPLTPGMIMVGKTVPAVIVALIQGTMILLAAVIFYRVPFEGSLILLYLSIFFYAIAVSGIGLLISSVCETQQQAFLGVFTFMMPAVMLSGYAAPIDNMPEWLQVITEANPLRHLIVIVKSIFLKGSSTEFVLDHVWPLLLIAMITNIAANWMFGCDNAPEDGQRIARLQGDV